MAGFSCLLIFRRIFLGLRAFTLVQHLKGLSNFVSLLKAAGFRGGMEYTVDPNEWFLTWQRSAVFRETGIHIILHELRKARGKLGDYIRDETKRVEYSRTSCLDEIIWSVVGETQWLSTIRVKSTNLWELLLLRWMFTNMVCTKRFLLTVKHAMADLWTDSSLSLCNHNTVEDPQILRHSGHVFNKKL